MFVMLVWEVSVPLVIVPREMSPRQRAVWDESSRTFGEGELIALLINFRVKLIEILLIRSRSDCL